MTQGGNSVANAVKKGGALAISLFLILYIIMMMSADGITEAVNIFERSLLTVISVFVPVTKIGAVISVLFGTIAAAISLDGFDPSITRAFVAFGFVYTLTNLIINWFTVPV